MSLIIIITSRQPSRSFMPFFSLSFVWSATACITNLIQRITEKFYTVNDVERRFFLAKKSVIRVIDRIEPLSETARTKDRS